MCGIAGIISPKPGNLQDVQQMIACLSHRGPDGESTWQNEAGTVAFAHRRLAIIDLSPAASQPMHYLDRYSIVHNGEIYNYKEVRSLLSAKGYTFKTQSDTEVVLAAYDHWKEECLQYFDGMFAFAIWDEKEQTLFAVRDRFGEKPFYYVAAEEGFWFASEIKSLKKAGLAGNSNGNLLLQYLANGFVQDAMDNGATFYDGIKKLPARHFLKYDLRKGELLIKPYFDIDKEVNASIRVEEAVATFKELFFTSVDRRLRSDVEIGTSLSGGLDSSSVVAAVHHLKQSGAVQKAFTASFPGFEKDETTFAATVAKKFGLQHFTVQPSSGELGASLETFFAQHDEPVSSSSVFAQYKVYELASHHGIKVVLDGQGADEILAGYIKYIHWFLQELYSDNKTQFRKELKEWPSVPFGFKNKLAARFPSWTAIQLEKKAIKSQGQLQDISKEFAEEYLDKNIIRKPIIRSLNDILYFDVFEGGLEELLRNADRNAMAHGVEVRLPFLNHELVQFAFSLPSISKIKNGYTKYVLRQAMDDMLPSEITWRKDKVGFEPPQQQWMKDPQLQEKIHDAKKKLVSEKVLKASILQKPVQPKAAHEAHNYDWRFLCAAHLL